MSEERQKQTDRQTEQWGVSEKEKDGDIERKRKRRSLPERIISVIGSVFLLALSQNIAVLRFRCSMRKVSISC